MTDVRGSVAPGFDPIVEQLAWNMTELGEIGCAFAATLDGVPVVDLCAGLADAESGEAWAEDTLQVIFSGTKGLTAACLLLLVERGLVSLDAPLAEYWPEFGAAGKEEITVAEVASHRAGVPTLRRPTTNREALRVDEMATRVAAQAPFPEVLGRVWYHAVTYGWMVGELVRRVDGRRIGRFFAEELADPLALETWIGLPVEQHGRVGRLTFDAPPEHEPPTPPGFEDLMALSANPPILTEDLERWNTPEIWSAEIAAGGAVSTARSMARFYACLAAGGELDGTRVLAPETVQLGRTPLVDEPDARWGARTSYGVGFALYPDEWPGYPLVPDWFGHGGFGGSEHGAWPSAGVAFSYIPNRMRQDPSREPEGIGPGPRLLTALSACVRARRGHA